MTRVVLIGLEPATVDFSDPDLPPGVDAERIAAGIAATMADMRARGWTATFCALTNDSGDEAAIAAALREPCDCVVIGGGIRLPRANLLLFERVVNAVHRAAPGTAIAFNTMPNDSADAVARWVTDGAIGS